MKNSLDTAREEGMEEGIEKGIEKEKIEVAKKALKKGYTTQEITDLTGLTAGQIKRIGDIND